MDKRELRKFTEEYWELVSDKDDLESQLEMYLEGDNALFRKEISWLQDDENLIAPNGQRRLPKTGCKTLVCLVGFSIEPILQTVWAYKPQEQIVLLLNRAYIDEYGLDFGEKVHRLIERLYKVHLSEMQTPPIDLQVLEDVALPVFDKLRTLVRTSKEVVIDITGGKKKMISEAFLYAAYADIDVSYVDFDDDEYHVKWRRPYGFACQIGRLKNPYQAFALRDWEQVKKFYQNYNFRAAKKALDELQKNLRTAGFDNYLQELQIEVIRKLETMLACYEAWESGDFNQAKSIVPNISWEIPSAITQLGGSWFNYNVRESRFDNAPGDFYADINKFNIYVYDELKRITRLQNNEDYRSIILRAAGLNEVIILGRLTKLVSNQNDRLALSAVLVKKSPFIKHIFKVLLGLRGTNITIGGKDSRCTIEVDDFSQQITTTVSPMNRWWTTETKYFQGSYDWENFLSIRNKLTHAYFTVPSDLAIDALAFTKANFEDFLQVYEHTTISELERAKNLSAIRLSWPDFCESCGLDKLLPHKLLE